MESLKTKRRTLLLCVGLVLVTIASYFPVFQNDFTIYDDQQYITENPYVVGGLSWESAKWAFTEFYSSNWHPVTWLSHMLDVQLFGLNPAWHHGENLLFHVLNSLLLFLLLKRLTSKVWQSFVVAALFALHPLHVESVAWAAERKDVLSAFFFFLTLLTYNRYVEFERAQAEGKSVAPTANSSLKGQIRLKTNLPSRTIRGAWAWYSMAICLFAIGLLCKPILVTTPFVLLLLDYWPLNRVGKGGSGFRPQTIGKLVVEKLPFLALSAVSCLITIIAQKRGEAVVPLEWVSLGMRVQNACVAYFAYLSKALFPIKLAVFYPCPRDGWPPVYTAFAILVMLIISAAVLWLGRNRPYLRMGWFWYLGMLVPVIGLVQVGSQAFADRYTYLPLVGFLIMISWLGADVIKRVALAPKLAGGLVFAALAILAVLTFRQVGFWRDSETLFIRCLNVTRDNIIAENNLAVALIAKGKYADAQVQCEAGLRVDPNSAILLENMAVALAMRDDYEGAKTAMTRALAVDKNAAVTYGKLGLVMSKTGRIGPAVSFYQEQLKLQPDDARACNNLAWLLATAPNPDLRNGKAAVEWAERGCRLTQNQVPVCFGTLAAAYAEAGRFPEAIKAAETAIQLARATADPQLEQTNTVLLELYRSGKPFHDVALSAAKDTSSRKAP